LLASPAIGEIGPRQVTLTSWSRPLEKTAQIPPRKRRGGMATWGGDGTLIRSSRNDRKQRPHFLAWIRSAHDAAHDRNADRAGCQD